MPCRHALGDRWFAHETYIKIAGRWAYVYRTIDQHGQVIDVLLSERRDPAAAARFFTRALRVGAVPAEITTDRVPVYARVLDELVPSALHIVEQYANNPVEADHGRLKARLRPMRGLKRRRWARILTAGHAICAESAPWPLRHRYRSLPLPQAPRGIRRPRARHLNHPSIRIMLQRCSGKAQRNNALAANAVPQGGGAYTRDVTLLAVGAVLGGFLSGLRYFHPLAIN